MAISAGWSEGYVTDTLYTDHVFREQSPAWINYVATVQGCAPRPLDGAFSYLELGCGMGHSITIFAAAHPKARFVGVDFNPAHIDHAQRRAKALGLDNLTFIEASFQDLAADSAGTGIARDLGSFDFVTLHGIYSWISAEARVAVQRLIFERLLPGGLVYNSYNCLPGWAVEAPLQRLMKEFSAQAGGASPARIRSAFTQIQALSAEKTGYFNASPLIPAAIDNFAKKPDNYLVHEFLNGDWNAFYVTDVAAEMAAAKLDFVGSATIAENHGDLLLSAAAQKLVAESSDPLQRQLLQDFLINQKFRRDVYVRGHGRLDRTGIALNRARQCYVTLKSLDGLSPSIKVRRGTVNIDPERFKHLVGAIGDWAATEAEIVGAFAKSAGNAGDVARLLNVLVAAGHLMPAATVPPRPRHGTTAKGGDVRRATMTLKANAGELATAIQRRAGVTFSSPVMGHAAVVSLSDALIIDELVKGGGSQDELAARVGARMRAIGLRPAKDGKTIADPAAATEQIKTQIEGFVARELPNLVRLGILAQAS